MLRHLPYHLNSRPLLWFAVCFVFGSAAAAGWSGSGIFLCGGGLALLLAALAAARRMSVPLAAACLAAYAAAAGGRIWSDARGATALQDILAAAEVQFPPPETKAEAAGTIVSPVVIDGDLVSFKMAADSVAVIGEAAPRAVRERLLVKVRLQRQPEQQTAAGWQRGDRVRAAGLLALPAEASNRGGFDYRRYLRSQGIHWLLEADGAAAIEAAPGSPFSAAGLLARIDSARAVMGAGMDRLYPDIQSGYMKGLVLGITDDLDPALYRQFSQLGLTHILAISGLHVAVVLYALGAVLRLLRQPRERILGVLIAAVPLYVLLSGASPSVIRAGIMAVLGLTAARMNKLKDGLHLLAASAVLMLVWNPLIIENVSFQLSYLVTAGLIVGVPMVNRLLPNGKRGKRLRDAAVVTVTAQAASFPLTIYYFNQFHLLSLPANLLLVSFISAVIMPVGAVSLLLLLLWPSAAGLLADAAAFGNKWTFELIGWMNGADTLRTIWATPPLWWIAAWYGTLALLLNRLAGHVRAAAMVSNRQVTAPRSTGAAVFPPFAPSRDDTVPLGAGISSAHPTGDIGWMRAGGTAVAAGGAGMAGMLALARAGTGGRRGFSVMCTALTAAAAALLLVYAWNPGWNDTTARVSILDVGQGDSILVCTPSGKHMLVDGGGTPAFRREGEEWRERRDPFEIGRKTVVPLLMKRGVKEIDLLVVSHLDSDHIGGLQALLESVPVRRILWNGSVKRSDDAAKLLQTALNRNIPLYGAEKGQAWRIDRETTIDVLWPWKHAEPAAIAATTVPAMANNTATAKPGSAAGASAASLIPVEEEQNEASVVSLITMYGRTFLLTGDIGTETEQAILEDRRAADAAAAASSGANSLSATGSATPTESSTALSSAATMTVTNTIET
ncbi:ComEC/Rec2 family competence protein [Paenibacillus beijingensis]|uniref:ComEC/Rec2 family competence protein n=1 Tax=Paenibacillus beijingensis TaxID=1126833 RepID=UPI000697C985|nr:ComEC/Rec2 family competence protein [Paenibacillus beijingensis]